MALGGLLIVVNAYELYFDKREQQIEDFLPSHKIKNPNEAKELLIEKNCYHDYLSKEICQHYYCEQLRDNIIRAHYTSNQKWITP